MKKKKILIADDEKDIVDFLQYTFENVGFEVIACKDGIQALKQAKLHHPDVILLDIMMPNLEGTSVCEHLRKQDEFKNTPIVFLTAQHNEETEVNAFKIGADDFIAKPIKPKALVSRINKLLLAKNSDVEIVGNKKRTKIYDAEIDHETYTLFYKGIAVELARKEFQLVDMLASKPGKVFKRKEIFDNIWGANIAMGDRTIDVHVRKIRVKTADDFIKTVKGVGFKIEA